MLPGPSTKRFKFNHAFSFHKNHTFSSRIEGLLFIIFYQLYDLPVISQVYYSLFYHLLFLIILFFLFLSYSFFSFSLFISFSFLFFLFLLGPEAAPPNHKGCRALCMSLLSGTINGTSTEPPKVALLSVHSSFPKNPTALRLSYNIFTEFGQTRDARCLTFFLLQ